MRKLIFSLAFLPVAGTAWAQTVTRGPYLQQGSDSAVTVRWRTSTATSSRVRYGTAPSALDLHVDSAGSRTEHEMRLTGLAANTTYTYSVGSAEATLAGGADCSFTTAPAPGSSKPTRVWVLGDPGTKNSNQRAVRDAYYAFAGSRRTDLWLMLGDNAYSSGTDSEYQAAVFDMYPTVLRHSVLWPTFGNHDAVSANSSSQSGPYYDMFTLPKNAEAGGTPSGTEAYYSFTYGNIHFVCLDSSETSLSATGAMAEWLKSDLAATSSDWIVAFFHHPPYTKGSYDSDVSSVFINIRQNLVPILEAGGVDLVLCGHSHNYQRSFLLDGHYGLSSTLTAAMLKDPGDGRENGDGAYRKSAGNVAREGAVYIVAGSSGQASTVSAHPAMYLWKETLGSVVLDFDRGRLDVRFLRETGAVDDTFTLIKGDPGVPAPEPPPPPPVAAGHGLRGEYFNTWNLQGPSLVRLDPAVDFDWGAGAPLDGINADGFGVRWTGFVTPEFTETYTFSTLSSEGARLWVNDVLVIDKGVDQAPTEWSGSVSLTAGQSVPIRLEYYDNTGSAVMKLGWSSASTPKSIVPEERLSPTVSADGGPVKSGGSGSGDRCGATGAEAVVALLLLLRRRRKRA